MKKTSVRLCTIVALLSLACGDDEFIPAATETEGTSTFDSTTTGVGDTAGSTSGFPGTTNTSTNSGETDTDGCVSGSEDCACIGGVCGPGLSCVDGICEPTIPECGNGILEAEEECDLGDALNNDNGICKVDCTAQVCGDGFTGPGEACDDGNGVNDDSCTNNCALRSCGDMIVQPGEDCDDANADNSDACLDTCLAASCGDDFIQVGIEECDDANVDPTDMCTTQCLLAVCGDGFVWEDNEPCDDGNAQQGDGCNNDCEPSAQDVWSTMFHGGDGNDRSYDVAVNAIDEIAVVGRVFATGQSCDIFVGKYDADGNELWSDRVNGTANLCDYARGVEFDSSGNVIVGGTIVHSDTGRDVWLRKYDADGNEVWTHTHDHGDEGLDDFAFDIAVDSNDDAWIVGSVTEAGQGQNIWVRQVGSASGTEVSTLTFDGPGSGDDLGQGIAIDASDNVIITGRVYVDATNNFDLFVRKYDAGGTLVWERTHNGSDTASTDGGWGVDVDANGAVVVVGYADNLDQGFDLFVRMYNADGDAQWTDIEDNNGSGLSEYGRDVTFSPDGTVVVVAEQFFIPGDLQMWARKYATDSTTYWTRTHDGPVPGGDDSAFGVAVDSMLNVLVVGWEVTIAGGEDIRIHKYTP